MAISKKLIDYSRYFNTEGNLWYFTKARAVKPDSLPEIIRYHQVLKETVIVGGKTWNRETQREYANTVAPGSSDAWARELKTLFNLLGTAWVENDMKVKLTPTGEALLAGDDPGMVMERQVRKYQIGNPELSTGTSARLTDKVRLIPHKALIELLLSSYPKPITKDEFVIFVSRVLSPDDVDNAKELLESYRALSDSDREKFKDSLDPNVLLKIERIFSYAAQFLAFPRYLKYTPGRIEVADEEAAQRVLDWYDNGNDTHIAFSSRRDWFSHYGSIDATPNPLHAIDYYRKTRRVKEAVSAYRQATRKGLLLDDKSENGFECRIQGEAALEEWLVQNLHKLEDGLSLVEEQYQTEDAGRIDILAKDSQQGYVVVELKRDKASDSALGQILRYIGWVRLNLLSNDEMVRGYVVGDRFDDKIAYALLSNDAIDTMCRLIDYRRLGVRLDTSRTEEGCNAQVVELPA